MTWTRNLFFCFISMKTSSPFIWGIIYICTMDGFFRILEKTSSELICTRQYLECRWNKARFGNGHWERFQLPVQISSHHSSSAKFRKQTRAIKCKRVTPQHLGPNWFWIQISSRHLSFVKFRKQTHAMKWKRIWPNFAIMKFHVEIRNL